MKIHTSDYFESFKGKTLQKYKDDYSELLGYYKKQSEDNDEINFINSEIIFLHEYIKPVIENQKTELEQKGIFDLDKHLIKGKLSSYHKIISFLESKKSELEDHLAITTQQLKTELLDLSDTSAVEKIIYLNELGIIDFLRSKAKIGISNGGLASVISAITGIKQGTIKPSLNRLDKNDIDDNKHPYFKTENVTKIKKRIEDLGL